MATQVPHPYGSSRSPTHAPERFHVPFVKLLFQCTVNSLPCQMWAPEQDLNLFGWVSGTQQGLAHGMSGHCVWKHLLVAGWLFMCSALTEGLCPLPQQTLIRLPKWVEV